MRLIKPLPVSVGGVDLLVIRITDELGRAWAVHESPGAEQAELEDMGRAPAKHSIEAVIFGAGWMERLDALRVVVETPLTPEPISFVHPFWGLVTGVVTSLNIEHEDKRHDYAAVRLTVVEGRSLASREATETAAAAKAAATAALATARAALEVW